MGKICPISKKTTQVGGGYSNRTRATQYNPTGKVRRSPNFQTKKIYVPELKKSITLTITARAIKTIQKNGAYATLKKAGLIKNGEFKKIK
ncbi:MAG: bL28 family ribosomal protein [Minisyncoccia bacterium]